MTITPAFKIIYNDFDGCLGSWWGDICNRANIFIQCYCDDNRYYYFLDVLEDLEDFSTFKEVKEYLNDQI